MGTSFAFVMWINLLIVSAIKPDLQLRTWKCPDWVVGVFIAAGIFTLIKVQTLQAIGLNVLIMVTLLYFYQGLAIVAFFMTQRKWARFIKWFIYILILSQIYIMIISAALGLFDTWFNFRKRIRNQKEM